MHIVMISVAAGKILLAKTNWFFHPKIQVFQNFPLHSLRSTCHSTCPLPQRVLLSKRTSHLYESLLNSRVGAIRVSEANLRFWTAFRARSGEFSANFMIFTYHGWTIINLEETQTFCSAYGSSWGFACTKLWYQWQVENIPGENELVLSWENSTFPPKFYT